MRLHKKGSSPGGELPSFVRGGDTDKPNFHRLSVFGLASCWLGFCSFLGLFYAVSSSPHDFVFTASDDLLTCSKNVAVKVSFVFVVWKEACK